MKNSIVSKAMLFVLSFSILSTSCEKEKDEFTNLTPKQSQDALSEIKKEVEANKDRKYKSQDLLNPENPNNQMDFIGVYFEDMILDVNSSEISSPSTTQQDYENKFTTYLSNNDIGYDFSDLEVDTSNSFMEIANLAIDYSLQDTAENSINSLIAFENAVSSSNSLNHDQKILLLSLSSSLKYTRATMANEGLVINGQQIAGNYLKLSMACFDQAFSEGAFAGFSTLTDWDNAPLAIAAWAGLPVTITASIANGFWRGFTADC